MRSEKLITEIAEAVQLREGPMGVRSVLWALAWRRPQSTKEWSHTCRLPVPVVAAIRGELVQRGYLEDGRRPRLTPEGTRLLHAMFGGATKLDSCCPVCAGEGLVIPAGLSPVLDRFTAICAERPECDVTLDQSHGTPETGIRRSLLMIGKGLVSGRRVAFLGDDDLVSLALGLVLRTVHGGDTEHPFLVFDIDARFIDFIRERAAGLGIPLEAIRYDVRDPVPERFIGSCDTVITDPPYTVNGMTLFAFRAAQLIRDEGGDLMLSYADPAPRDLREIERELNRQGWGTVDLRPGFNRYEGSAIHGQQSTLRHLQRTEPLSPENAAGLCYSSMYTGDLRPPGGEYRCTICETSILVGPGEEYNTIADLKRSGCPECGGTTFRRYG